MDHSLEAVTLAYAEAVLAKDPTRLAALYTADVRVFDAWGTWSYEGMTAWRANLDAWLGSLGEDRVRVSFDDLAASTSGDLGWITGIVTYAALDAADETLRAMQNRLTWVLVRRGEGWAIAHEHTSAPIDFDHQKAILRRD